MSITAGSLRFFTRLSALAGIAALAACSDQFSTNPLSPDRAAASRGIGEDGSGEGAVFVATNGVNGNEVKAFSRAANGSLALLGTFATGGNGVGGTGAVSYTHLTLPTSDLV